MRAWTHRVRQLHRGAFGAVSLFVLAMASCRYGDRNAAAPVRVEGRAIDAGSVPLDQDLNYASLSFSEEAIAHLWYRRGGVWYLNVPHEFRSQVASQEDLNRCLEEVSGTSEGVACSLSRGPGWSTRMLYDGGVLLMIEDNFFLDHQGRH